MAAIATNDNKLKIMSLKDIQQVSLDILKDVHQFCVDNHICYTLFGGTMIGAIRHKGFIPWDDDIDIAMPRPDYERFLEIYQSKKGYRLFASGTKGNYLAFSRVCEMEHTLVVNSVFPWSNTPTGVWIDIFPLDGAEDDIDMAQCQFIQLRKMWKKCSYARAAKAKLSSAKGLQKKTKLILKRLLFSFPWQNHDILLRKYINMCQRIKWGESKHFGNLSYMRYGIKEYEDMEDFTTTILVDFEDSKFMVCNGYDRMMKCKYGDYMQLPPIDKQCSNHHLCYYYWKIE